MLVDNIKEYNSKKDLGNYSITTSDDGTIVFFKRMYDPESGVAKAPEVVFTTCKVDLLAEKAMYQENIDLIDGFILNENL